MYFKMGVQFCIFLILTNFLAADSLYCYRCFSLDCPETAPECEEHRKLVQQELRKLYYFGQDIPECPDPNYVNAGHDWRRLQIMEDEPCEAESPNEETCVLGQIQTAVENPTGNILVRHHGTVLGCAKRSLLHRLKPGKCDTYDRILRMSDKSYFHFKVQHCARQENVCYKEDFCIDIKQVRSENEEKGYWSRVLIGSAVLLALVTLLSIVWVWGRTEYNNYIKTQSEKLAEPIKSVELPAEGEVSLEVQI